MALAVSLIPGFQYRVLKGLLEGELVTIVDNTPFPDGDIEGRQRKITVSGPDGEQFYIIPRLLDSTPVGVGTPQAATVPAHSFVQAPPLVEVAREDLPASIAATVPAGVTVRQFAPITDPMDPRLDHLRPSRAKLKTYINRTMANGQTDTEFLLTFTNDDYRAKNQGRPANVMLKGGTQGGKTFVVEVLAWEWAKKLGLPQPMPIFTLSGSAGITDFDLFGQTTSYTDPLTGQESLVWLPGIVDMAAQVGGILYLDEVNLMKENVTSSLHPLCDHRHYFLNRNKPVFKAGQFLPETVVASEDLWIIGTYNEGYKGTSDMNEAFINRFRHIIWEYDDAVENKLVTSPAIRLLGTALRTAREANQIRTPIGTSALQRVQEDVEAFGISLGMTVFTGMFKAQERPVVESIIEDRSIFVMLQEEQRQARIDP
jgi:nitric oxide reductase NorQ protein/cobaltochelatase CobS